MEKKQRKRYPPMVREEEDEGVGSAAWLSQFDERDFEASHILLQLQSEPMALPRPATAVELERGGGGGGEKKRIPFTVVWGRRKLLASKSRRPAAGGLSGGTTLAAAPAVYPSQRVKAAAAQATSPDTPLNTNQHSSESEDCSRLPRQPAKKKRKELVQNLQELNDCREKLRKEVENVTAYYKELLASNKMWKQTKQMVEKSNAEVKNCSKFGVRSGQLYLDTQNHQRQFLHHPNPTAKIEPQETFQLQYHHHNQGPHLYGQGPSMLPMGRLSNKIGPLPKSVVVHPGALEQERARKRAEKARKRRKMLIQERQHKLQKSKFL